MKILLMLLAAAVLAAGQEPGDSATAIIDTASAFKEPAPAPRVFSPGVKVQTSIKQELVFPKDPVLAAFLSVTLPGLGQLYVGKYGRAALWAGLVATSTLAIWYLPVRAARSTQWDTVVVTNTNGADLLTFYQRIGTGEMSARDTLISNIAGTVQVLAWAGAVVDAYFQAKKHNRIFLAQKEDKVDFRLTRAGVFGDGIKGEVAIKF
jgi:hypothetical protein